MARGLLSLRHVTALSPSVRGLGKIIPPLMDLSRRLPASSQTAIVDNVDGDLRMELDLGDLVQGYIFWNPRGYEKYTLAVLKEYVKPGDTVLDLGANVGFYSLIATKLVGPSGVVVAVEPDPLTYARLCRNVALNGFANVRTVNQGLAEAPGRLRLVRRMPGNAGAQTFVPAAGDADSVEVEVNTLDRVIEDLNLPRVDFVKIDVEGFEYKVLSGFNLERYQPIIVTEVYDELLRGAGSSAKEYVEMLKRRGYNVKPIERDELNAICVPLSRTDTR